MGPGRRDLVYRFGSAGHRRLRPPAHGAAAGPGSELRFRMARKEVGGLQMARRELGGEVLRASR